MSIVVDLSKSKKILAIDFDGTVVEAAFPNIGSLREGAKSYINRLYDEGYIIVIWTCRCDDELGDSLDEAKTFLKHMGVRFHCINTNPQQSPYPHSFPKIYADVYIDDKQVGGLPSWKEIYEWIKSMDEWTDRDKKRLFKLRRLYRLNPRVLSQEELREKESLEEKYKRVREG